MKKKLVLLTMALALVGLTVSPVLAHGGTIEARSEPGEGAEFIVKLPIVSAA